MPRPRAPAEIGVDHPRVVPNDIGRALADHRALRHDDDVVGARHHHVHVVLDKEEGDAFAPRSASTWSRSCRPSTLFTPAIGSSSRSSFGSAISARANSSSLRWPPESDAGIVVRLAVELEMLEAARRALARTPRSCCFDLRTIMTVESASPG